MKTVVLFIALLSVSFVPEVMDADFTLELRPLVFAVVICGLVFVIGMMEWRNNGLLKKMREKVSLIDMVYATCVGMTVVFLFLKSAEMRAFHYAFVSVGMFVVYFFFRGIFCHSGTADTEEENHNNCDHTFKEKSFQARRLSYIRKEELLMFLIVAVGFVNALIGLVQFFCGKDVVGTFGVESFFGCFLAVNVPIAFGLLLNIQYSTRNVQCSNNKIILTPFIKGGILTAVLVMIFVVVLTKSRTAMIGLGVVLPTILYFYHRDTKPRRIKSKLSLRLGVFARVIIFVVFAFFCGKILYELKPVSAVGRTLIWRVSADMFLKNPVSGVGYGNFANVYNYYQGEFFANGGGTEAQKMAASTIRHAYNWYLETAAEFGFFGSVVFGIFWWLVLMEVYNIFKPHKEHKDTENTKLNIQYSTRNVQYSSEEIKTDYVNLGMAGSVLCFMIMCLFHFPYKIIPTYLIFNIALAWIVTTNENLATDETQMKHG